MKTIFSLIFVFMAIAIIGFFINKKMSENNPTIVPSENANKNESLPVGNESSSVKIINFSAKGGSAFGGKNINMKLTSSAFENNQYITSKYTCDGVNVNPPLLIVGAPKNAKSLVLIVDDPDATNGDWVHWTIFNVPPDTKEIKENSAPAGAIEGETNFRNPGYGGPCPSSGIHHYQFKLYALDAVLSLDASAEKKDIEKAMEGHILARDVFVGLYKRK